MKQYWLKLTYLEDEDEDDDKKLRYWEILRTGWNIEQMSDT